MNIISIQSHVSYGYVGNKAAVFPLQMLGFNVWPVNTVQFSNHTGYGEFKGQVFSAQHIREVIAGIKNLGVAHSCDAIISGYLGDREIGEEIISIVQDFKKENPKLIYLCDPVMGDMGRGFFVNSIIRDFFKLKVLNRASIITPNHFEAEFLYGNEIKTIENAKKACKYFHNHGINIVVITSFKYNDLEENKLGIFMSNMDEAFIAHTPYFDFKVAPNGTGDLFSALFLGHYLKNNNSEEALVQAVSSLYCVVKNSFNAGSRELDIISHDYRKNTTLKQIIVKKV